MRVTGSKKSVSRATQAKAKSTPSELIDGRIAELDDWRGELLGRIRKVIKQAVPDVVEEWKWRGVPVWEQGGIICTGETYKNAVKMTFAKGAALPDPAKLFNSSLEGNTRRAIDFHEGGRFNESALKALVRAAADLNSAKKKPRGAAKAAKKSAPKKAAKKSAPKKSAPKAAAKRTRAKA